MLFTVYFCWRQGRSQILKGTRSWGRRKLRWLTVTSFILPRFKNKTNFILKNEFRKGIDIIGMSGGLADRGRIKTVYFLFPASLCIRYNTTNHIGYVMYSSRHFISDVNGELLGRKLGKNVNNLIFNLRIAENNISDKESFLRYNEMIITVVP